MINSRDVEYWRDLMISSINSDLSITDWLKENDVSASTYNRWRKLFKAFNPELFTNSNKWVQVQGTGFVEVGSHDTCKDSEQDVSDEICEESSCKEEVLNPYTPEQLITKEPSLGSQVTIRISTTQITLAPGCSRTDIEALLQEMRS